MSSLTQADEDRPYLLEVCRILREDLAMLEARGKALEAALRLVLIKSTDFQSSYCNLCHTKDSHADDCVSTIANAALTLETKGTR
jgi:hypothetical protein